MLATAFLFGGGLLFWVGLCAGRRRWWLAGAVLLALALAGLAGAGGVHPAFLPALVGMIALTWALETSCGPAITVGRAVGWACFVLLVLALGFRLLPGLTPVVLLEVGGEALRFPPEKLLLLGLVPPLVLAAVAPARPWGRERPARTFLLALAVTLAVLIPLALLLGYARPGWPDAPLPRLAYGLAYNFLFVCVLEESFFRGIVQTALICGARRRGWPHADVLAVLGASVLFGVVHLGGGAAFALLATLAGLGYGAVYYWTGRLHYAVLLHFAVNAVHLLAFAAPAA